MNELLIDIKNISAGYDGKIVLKDVSLQVYKQDFIGIIGPNGGGKTTFVKVILGLIKPWSGSIYFARKDLKMQMGYMPQTNSIDRKFPILVSEVVASGLACKRNLSKAQRQERIREVIDEMGIETIRHTPIGELSGGQLQRTLLARALINKPELLILDEPDSYVDKRFELHFYKLLQEINRKTAIILISHDIGTVISTVKNIACVNETLHYHSGSDIDGRWLEEYFECPFDIIGHGDIPHRILKKH
jgi:zinc transport system ATP-binding protein